MQSRCRHTSSLIVPSWDYFCSFKSKLDNPSKSGCKNGYEHFQSLKKTEIEICPNKTVTYKQFITLACQETALKSNWIKPAIWILWLLIEPGRRQTGLSGPGSKQPLSPYLPESLWLDLKYLNTACQSKHEYWRNATNQERVETSPQLRKISQSNFFGLNPQN